VSIDTAILGATGYVGGELLRLLSGHAEFRLTAAVSASRGGEAIGSVFPHLAPLYQEQQFVKPDSWMNSIDNGTDLALFSAAPHGASAPLVQHVLDAAARRDLNVHVVDSSADFRYRKAEDFAAVYGIGLFRECNDVGCHATDAVRLRDWRSVCHRSYRKHGFRA